MTNNKKHTLQNAKCVFGYEKVKKLYKWKEAGTFVPARMKKKNIL